MNLLLDTHLLLWSAFAADRIAPATARRLLDPVNALWFSAASIWEVAIKRRLGKLDAPDDLLAQLERAGVDLLSITAAHADRVATLPMHHQDPFDRLLIAQAITDGLTLVSADGAMRNYEIEVLW